ncbi:oxidoreductase [Pontibaca salina]|uniref:NADH:flavin oxidoreductase/NADH oxidase N-terminal domain-containing protein n=1 Tax=Pontibaca salina TaxID=2795731 RepID=A0A934HUB4_9RHOB|nr:hypothetical protein [Pontibaca salina]MBI6630920.1 hypothetical protein [Pontibaca salina]
MGGAAMILVGPMPTHPAAMLTRGSFLPGDDAVEVWAAHHGLLDQFWTPMSSTRSDEWGESLNSGTRFSRDVLRRICVASGGECIIGLAVNVEPDVKAALCWAWTSW